MFICQWSLEIVFGKQKEALAIMKEWGAEKLKSTNFKKSRNRIYVGHIGESPSLILDEYEFENLEDFVIAISEINQPRFRNFSEQIAPLVVPGTQRWKIFRVIT
jgi:methyl coenzyme M reductase subunit C-like uncharacterized protein (methanogenesis marker protein 7)